MVRSFQKHHGITFVRLDGKVLCGDTTATKVALFALCVELESFNPKDEGNAEERGLFHRQHPGFSIAKSSVFNTDTDKTRLTVLACFISDESEKFSLMTNESESPTRPFRGKYDQHLGFDYHANKNAWMKQTFFFTWLGRLNRHVSRTPGKISSLSRQLCSVRIQGYPFCAT